MLRLDPETGKQKWYTTDGAKSVLSAIISILIGMAVGMIIIVIVGLTKDNISAKGRSKTGIHWSIQYGPRKRSFDLRI